MTYFTGEQLILDKLDAEITKVPKNHVLSAADMEGVKEQFQVNPALQVFLYDDVPVPGKNGVSGPNQLVDQYYLVVVVVKNVRDKSGKSARVVAGPMVNEVIKLLHNFDPGHPYSKLTRVKAPYRATYRGGFFYFPMMFKTRFSTTGNKNGR